jgi:hypothetical protein
MRSRVFGVTLVVCAAATFFLPAVHSGASGYRYTYDYAEQGDDWYGRSDGPDPGRDYPAFEMDLYSAGDDYGYGYDAAVDILSLAPPLDLTLRRHTEYHFRFFTLVGCLEALDCTDDVFCNGEEHCSSAGCGSGVPACEDIEPCTIDTCDELLDTCSNTWVPPPDEVTGLQVDRQAPGSLTATLSWDAAPDADWYNVYRGEHDDGAVAPGGLYCLLTSAEHCDLESSLGEDSDGVPRPDPGPCP